jgi:hypothetical protein
LLAIDDIPGSEEHCERAIAIYERLLKADPASAELRDLLAGVNDVLAALLAKKGARGPNSSL